MGHRPLQPGTKIYFVAQHLDKTAPEIAALAEKKGIELAPKHVHTCKAILKKKYGITEPIAKRGRPAGSKAKAKAKASAPRARSQNGHADHADDDNSLLQAVIVKLGTERLRELLDSIDRTLGR